MTLQEILEQRLTAAGQQAQVVCGALGTLTVQGLSPREFSLLSRSADAPRQVLYAACRQLQQAGEAMRSRGMLFRPEEITDYITQQEAQAAYAVIAGMSVPPAAPEEEKDAPEGILPSSGGEEAEGLPAPAAVSSDDALFGAALSVPEAGSTVPPALLSAPRSPSSREEAPPASPARGRRPVVSGREEGRQQAQNTARLLLEGLQRAAAAAP